jgi:serine/threonine protein kinase
MSGSALGWSRNFELNYRIGKSVGTGSNARVHVAHSRTTKHLVAVKIVPKIRRHKSQKALIQRELDMLGGCQGHPNIVTFEDMYETDEDAYILTEFLPGGTLWQNVQHHGPYDENQVREIMRGLLQATKHCHERQILIGDLKSSNVMLRTLYDTNTATLVDFGSCKTLGKNERIYKRSGTPLFLPPESVQTAGYQTLLSDIYSAGVTMSNIATGKIPQIEQSQVGRYRIAVPCLLNNFSTAAHDLLSSLLNSDSSRPTAEEALQHPWFHTEEHNNLNSK